MTTSLSPTTERRASWRIGPVSLALILALLGLSACSSRQLLYQPFDEEGEPIAFKRRARHETRDLFHHWRRAVYIKVDKPGAASTSMLADGWESRDNNTEIRGGHLPAPSIDGATSATKAASEKPCEMESCGGMAKEPVFARNLSEDQRIVVAEFGAPDYIRPPFSARTREKTDEWLYLKDNLLVQFVDGFLVYSGNVTDKEHILLKRGYPSKNIRLSENQGPFRETLVYRNASDSKLLEYAFADDKLASSVE